MNKIVKCPLIWGGGPHVNFTMKSIKRAIVFKKKVKKVQKRASSTGRERNKSP